MQNRLKIALVVAVFFGLIAAYGIYNFLRQQRQTAEALRQETQNVIVAAKGNPCGHGLQRRHDQKGHGQGCSVAEGIGAGRLFSSPEQIVGKTNRVKIMANEPISESRLAGEGAGLTIRLEAGKRAMAVKVGMKSSESADLSFPMIVLM